MPFLGYRYNSHNNIKREKKKEKRLIREYYEPKTKKLTGHNKPFRKHAWLQRKYIHIWVWLYLCVYVYEYVTSCRCTGQIGRKHSLLLLNDLRQTIYSIQISTTTYYHEKFRVEKSLIILYCYIRLLYIFWVDYGIWCWLVRIPVYCKILYSECVTSILTKMVSYDPNVKVWLGSTFEQYNYEAHGICFGADQLLFDFF